MKCNCPDFLIHSLFLFGISLGMLLPNSVSAQRYKYPKFPPSSIDLDGFIPKGYLLVESQQADLNQDGIEDWVWVAEYEKYVSEAVDLMGIEPETLSKPRILGIAFGRLDGAYQLALQNNTFVLRRGEGGMGKDPLKDLTVHPDQTIEVHFLRTFPNTEWEATYIWQFQDQVFRLIRAETVEYDRMHGDKRNIQYDFVTGKIRTSYGNALARRRRPNITWIKLKKPVDITLKTISHPLSQEVIDGFRL
ncbi:MAG: hypothetical protein AAGA10_26050 [Bacteroidota bacterium]